MGVPWLRSGLAASSSSTTAPSPAEPSQGKMPCSVAARSYSSFRSLCFFHVRLGIANRTLGCRLEMCHNWDTWNFWPQRPLWAPGYHSPENRRFALLCLTQHIPSQQPSCLMICNPQDLCVAALVVEWLMASSL